MLIINVSKSHYQEIFLIMRGKRAAHSVYIRVLYVPDETFIHMMITLRRHKIVCNW